VSYTLALPIQLSPGVGLVVAGDDLDQRGFTGAVISQQANHFARLDVKIHVTQSLHLTKRLGYVFHLEHVLHRTPHKKKEIKNKIDYTKTK